MSHRLFAWLGPGGLGLAAVISCADAVTDSFGMDWKVPSERAGGHCPPGSRDQPGTGRPYGTNNNTGGPHGRRPAHPRPTLALFCRPGAGLRRLRRRAHRWAGPRSSCSGAGRAGARGGGLAGAHRLGRGQKPNPLFCLRLCRCRGPSVGGRCQVTGSWRAVGLVSIVSESMAPRRRALPGARAGHPRGRGPPISHDFTRK